jgi:hypothetical protein
MIDPSLLIDQTTFPDVSATVAQEQVWVSQAVYAALTGRP